MPFAVAYHRHFFCACLFSIAILPLWAQGSLALQSQLPYTHTANEEMSSLWGYSVAGHEYVIAGTTAGTSIVDVTNPSNPDEILWVSGPTTYWREAKVWGNRAYIVNEESGGLQIIDLSALPIGALSASNVSYWTGGIYQGNTISLSTAHTIYIDENGIAYLFGYNGNGGALMLDLAANPSNPPIVGRYTQYYIHDGFVRGDTLWAAHINNGFFSVIDVSNKSNPTVLAQQNTSNNFSHNIWVTSNGQYAFTTDEVSGSYIDAYDVSDLSDIRRVGQFRRTTIGIQHNVHLVQDRFAVIAAYRDGVTIIDVSKPQRMIEIANYDTSPTFSGNGFNGCWGVYPYFPSGSIAATDIEEGLYMLNPNYVGACFLEGIITDAATGALIQGASIQVAGNNAMNTNSDFSGYYLTGRATAGTISVTVSKTGYVSQTFEATLTNNNTITFNVALTSGTTPPFLVSGQVSHAATSNGIATANVLITDNEGNNYTATTNAAGTYSISLPAVGIYSIYAGKWGFVTQAALNQNLSASNNTVNLSLPSGYYDDFLFNFGWTVSTTATTGGWVRGEPYGTSSSGAWANPEEDISTDLGALCYVTGNPADSNPSNSDIDNGSTVLTSPVFDLSAYDDPHVKYSRWFRNSGGNTTGNDQMFIKLTNGSQTVIIETISNNDPYESEWRDLDLRISDYLTPTATMQLIADIGDLGDQHLVEGGLDGFSIEDHPAPTVRVQAKVWLTGCYDISTGTMRNTLRAANLLPLAQPYNTAPFNYMGTETISSNAQIPATAVDWILLEVRDAITSNIVERRAAWLLQNGNLADLDGNVGIAFSNLTAGNNYRLVIRHRNHLAVAAAANIVLPNATPYDFTQSTNVQGGATQLYTLLTTPPTNALYPADANANGIVQYADYNLFAAQNGATNTYNPADFNLDGVVNTADFLHYRFAASRLGVALIRY